MAKPTRKPTAARRKVSSAATRRGTWKPAFLATLAESANVSAAVRAAGVSRVTAYDHRRTDEAFARGWDHALDEAVDSLEAEAWRRARDGVEIPIVAEGQLCFAAVDPQGNYVPAIPHDEHKRPLPGYRLVPLMKRVYSDGLLTLLLKAARPAKYRDHVHYTGDGSLLAGDDGDDSIVLVHTAPPPPPPAAPMPASPLLAAASRAARRNSGV